MKRFLLPALLVAAALGVTILSASGSAKPAKTERTFSVIERDSEGSFRFVDNPPRAHRNQFRGGKLTAGDSFAVHQPLRTTKGRRVGALDAVCVATRGGTFAKSRFTCHGAYSFKHGTIELEALFAGGVKIAVTGGTGTYEGVSGSVKSLSRRNRTVDVIHLLLP